MSVHLLVTTELPCLRPVQTRQITNEALFEPLKFQRTQPSTPTPPCLCRYICLFLFLYCLKIDTPYIALCLYYRSNFYHFFKPFRRKLGPLPHRTRLGLAEGPMTGDNRRSLPSHANLSIYPLHERISSHRGMKGCRKQLRSPKHVIPETSSKCN